MLPDEYFPSRSTDQNFYDSVDVAVTCESMRSSSLFAIAPYHRRKSNPDIVHFVDRWTIARRNDEDWVYPRINYTFGTNAFRGGIQSELVARWSQGEEMMSPAEDAISRVRVMPACGTGRKLLRRAAGIRRRFDADCRGTCRNLCRRPPPASVEPRIGLPKKWNDILRLRENSNTH